MSACLLIRDKDNIFIGSDGAICYNNKNKNIRISNTGKKLFETDNYLFFCSGNYKYVKKTIQYIYESKPVELLNIQYFLKSMNIEKSEKYFNIEILLIEKKTLDVFQISEYNNFEIYKHEFPKKEEILVLSAGLKTDDLSNFAIKLISQSKDIKYIYKNVFNQISCNEVGGKMVVYKINKNLTSLFYEENIDNFYNVIKYNEENVHSVIANNIVGRMIAGNSLTITNDDGIVTRTFTLDQNGAVLENADFTLISDNSKIILNPDDGIKIQKNGNIIPVEYSANATSTGSSVTSRTFSTTVSSNPNRIMILGIGTNGPAVTSASRGAQSFTKLTSIARPTGNTAVSEIWYLTNPTSGTADVTVNFASSAFVEISATEFYNVDQTSPLKNTVTAQGNSANPTLTISEASSDDMIFDNLCHWSGTATIGTNQTLISQITSDGSWKLATGRIENPFDLTPSWTINSARDYAYCATVITSNKNVSVAYVDTFYVDTSGNVVFSGNLRGASGNFTGSITASNGYIGRWVIDANGIKDPSGNNSMYLFDDGSVNFQFAGLDLYRLSPVAGTGSFSYDGDTFEVSATSVAAFGITSNRIPDFQLWVDSLTMNGYAGVSGTFGGLTFVNGILVGT